jgi:cadmium resistance protein CadD (predicted permease)
LHLSTLSWAYQNLNGNPVAAFPSLHAAYPILAFLFLREDFVQRPWFIRFGYWIGVAMLFACCLPGAPFRQALGAALGFIAIFIGVWAAVLHGRAVKAAKPPATG